MQHTLTMCYRRRCLAGVKHTKEMLQHRHFSQDRLAELLLKKPLNDFWKELKKISNGNDKSLSVLPDTVKGLSGAEGCECVNFRIGNMIHNVPGGEKYFEWTIMYSPDNLFACSRHF